MRVFYGTKKEKKGKVEWTGKEIRQKKTRRTE